MKKLFLAMAVLSGILVSFNSYADLSGSNSTGVVVTTGSNSTGVVVTTGSNSTGVVVTTGSNSTGVVVTTGSIFKTDLGIESISLADGLPMGEYIINVKVQNYGTEEMNLGSYDYKLSKGLNINSVGGDCEKRTLMAGESCVYELNATSDNGSNYIDFILNVQGDENLSNNRQLFNF